MARLRLGLCDQDVTFVMVFIMTPEWIEHAEMLRRSIRLQIIKELDRGSGFV